jgi:hypothetical protein
MRAADPAHDLDVLVLLELQAQQQPELAHVIAQSGAHRPLAGLGLARSEHTYSIGTIGPRSDPSSRASRRLRG